jgi:hypothetical protein
MVVRNGMPATDRPSSAMTTVSPAKMIAEPAVAVARAIESVGELVAVAREQEEGVVDPDGQPEHLGEHRRGRGDRQKERGDEGEADGDSDAEEGGQQRHHRRDERSEHQEQGDQRDGQPGRLGRADARDVAGERVAAGIDLGAVADIGGEMVGDGGQVVPGGLLHLGLVDPHQDRDDRRLAVLGDGAGGVAAERV